MRRAVVPFLVVLALSGCGRQRVVTQPEVPPLVAPAPPPRVVTPPEAEETPPTAKPPETPARKPVRPATRTPEPVREPPKTEPPKPAAKPETPPATREETPPTTLQMLQPRSEAELAGQARALIKQARTDLAAVSTKSLNGDARGQYEQAKRFVEQAQQAYGKQNYVLAQRLAEKAATIAGVLVGR